MTNINENEIRADLFTSIRSLTPKAGEVADIVVKTIFDHSSNYGKKGLIELDESFNSAKLKRINNLFLDWRVLLNEISESVLLLCGAATIPIILPLAGLVIINKFYNLSSINLSRQHAIALWVLWGDRNQNNVISLIGLLESLNAELRKQRLKAIDARELGKIISDLSKCHCIKILNKDEVLMLERVVLN